MLKPPSLTLLSLLLAAALAPAAAAAPPLAAAVPGSPGPALELLPRVSFDALDLDLLAAEDAAREARGEPYRFAVSRPVFITPQSHGAWEGVEGDLLRWRLRISAAGAASLNLGFSRYRMPPGGELRVLAVTGEGTLGPFTAADHQPHGELWTPVILADDVVLEVTVPEAEAGELELLLTAVNQGYRGFGAPARSLAEEPRLAERSGSCNVDVACPEADPWADIVRSVGRYTRSGAFLCTGAMINNTSQDRRPLFLTAAHCGVTAATAPSVVVYWNYQSSFCRPPGSAESGQPGDGGLGQNQRGATHLATYAPSDFTLVELSSMPSSGWRVLWAGWDRTGGDPGSAIAIHHPQGQEKRISFENDPLATSSYLGTSSPGDGTHLRVIDWDLGTTEGGSSGSPLFTTNRRIVGQLHGGFAACGNNLSDWYGRLSVSWDGGGSPGSRLRDWLDPLGTGQTSLPGVNQNPPAGNRPAAPSNLAATPQSATEVLLAWQDNSGNETSFRVEAAVQGGSFAEVAVEPADTTSTVVTGLTGGMTYLFRVRARNAAGNSSYSNVATATTPSQPPVAPDRLRAQTVSRTEVLLTWRDLAGDEEAYTVEARTVAVLDGAGAAAAGVPAAGGVDRTTFVLTPFVEIANLPADSSSFPVTGLDPDTTYNFRVRAVSVAGPSPDPVEVAATTQSTAMPPLPCADGDPTLCLLFDRFEVRSFFRRPNGRTGDGRAVPYAGESGFFWFFTPSNLELVVKMLDGSDINRSFWVFFGALSDVEYWIVVTDSETGNRATFYNPPGGFCGGADIRALPAEPLPASAPRAGALAPRLVPESLRPLRAFPLAVPDAGAAVTPATREATACTPGEETLCLLDGRFRVEVAWSNPRNGTMGTGKVVPASDQTGLFWFFNADNVELIVKMLDGRGVNNKFWVFYGALTDLEYDVVVTDTMTGAQATYHNDAGNICGQADVGALDG